MRKTVLAAAGLTAVLAAPALAAETSGPFAGQVRQGQTRTHTFNNNPSNNPCLQITATYRVTLAYAPTTDVLTLDAGGKTASGSGSSVSFVSGVCTRFPIQVTGTSVADTATYVVTVTRDLLPPVSVS